MPLAHFTETAMGVVQSANSVSVRFAVPLKLLATLCISTLVLNPLLRLNQEIAPIDFLEAYNGYGSALQRFVFVLLQPQRTFPIVLRLKGDAAWISWGFYMLILRLLSACLFAWAQKVGPGKVVEGALIVIQRLLAVLYLTLETFLEPTKPPSLSGLWYLRVVALWNLVSTLTFPTGLAAELIHAAVSLQCLALLCARYTRLHQSYGKEMPCIILRQAAGTVILLAMELYRLRGRQRANRVAAAAAAAGAAAGGGPDGKQRNAGRRAEEGREKADSGGSGPLAPVGGRPGRQERQEPAGRVDDDGGWGWDVDGDGRDCPPGAASEAAEPAPVGGTDVGASESAIRSLPGARAESSEADGAGPGVAGRTAAPAARCANRVAASTSGPAVAVAAAAAVPHLRSRIGGYAAVALPRWSPQPTGAVGMVTPVVLLSPRSAASQLPDGICRRRVWASAAGGGASGVHGVAPAVALGSASALASAAPARAQRFTAGPVVVGAPGASQQQQQGSAAAAGGGDRGSPFVQLVRQLSAGDGALPDPRLLPRYVARTRLTSTRIKIHGGGAQPEQVAPGYQQRIAAVVAAAGQQLEGAYVRRGCIELVVDVRRLAVQRGPHETPSLASTDLWTGGDGLDGRAPDDRSLEPISDPISAMSAHGGGGSNDSAVRGDGAGGGGGSLAARSGGGSSDSGKEYSDADVDLAAIIRALQLPYDMPPNEEGSDTDADGVGIGGGSEDDGRGSGGRRLEVVVYSHGAGGNGGGGAGGGGGGVDIASGHGSGGDAPGRAGLAWTNREAGAGGRGAGTWLPASPAPDASYPDLPYIVSVQSMLILPPSLDPAPAPTAVPDDGAGGGLGALGAAGDAAAASAAGRVTMQLTVLVWAPQQCPLELSVRSLGRYLPLSTLAVDWQPVYDSLGGGDGGGGSNGFLAVASFALLQLPPAPAILLISARGPASPGSDSNAAPLLLLDEPALAAEIERGLSCCGGLLPGGSAGAAAAARGVAEGAAAAAAAASAAAATEASFCDLLHDLGCFLHHSALAAAPAAEPAPMALPERPAMPQSGEAGGSQAVHHVNGGAAAVLTAAVTSPYNSAASLELRNQLVALGLHLARWFAEWGGNALWTATLARLLRELQTLGVPPEDLRPLAEAAAAVAADAAACGLADLMTVATATAAAAAEAPVAAEAGEVEAAAAEAGEVEAAVAEAGVAAAVATTSEVQAADVPSGSDPGFAVLPAWGSSDGEGRGEGGFEGVGIDGLGSPAEAAAPAAWADAVGTGSWKEESEATEVSEPMEAESAGNTGGGSAGGASGASSPQRRLYSVGAAAAVQPASPPSAGRVLDLQLLLTAAATAAAPPVVQVPHLVPEACRCQGDRRHRRSAAQPQQPYCKAAGCHPPPLGGLQPITIEMAVVTAATAAATAASTTATAAASATGSAAAAASCERLWSLPRRLRSFLSELDDPDYRDSLREYTASQMGITDALVYLATSGIMLRTWQEEPAWRHRPPAAFLAHHAFLIFPLLTNFASTVGRWVMPRGDWARLVQRLQAPRMAGYILSNAVIGFLGFPVARGVAAYQCSPAVYAGDALALGTSITVMPATAALLALLRIPTHLAMWRLLDAPLSDVHLLARAVGVAALTLLSNLMLHALLLAAHCRRRRREAQLTAAAAPSPLAFTAGKGVASAAEAVATIVSGGGRGDGGKGAVRAEVKGTHGGEVHRRVVGVW